MNHTTEEQKKCVSFLRFVVSVAVLLLLASCTKEPNEKEGGFTHYLIERNAVFSHEVDHLAEKIDVYAANKKFSNEPNKSQITIHNSFSLLEGGLRTYSPRIGVKLHLPNLQKKLQLRFTTYDEDAEERGINENRYVTEQAQNTVGTSLALYQDLGKIKTEFRPRVEFTKKVETSYILKFSSEASRGTFSLKPELQLFARSDTGTGQFSAFNMDFQVAPQDELTLIIEEQYTDGDNTFATNHGIRWSHDYNPTLSHVNALVFESNNRDTYHLGKYVLSSSFRHKWYAEVLHYSVTPYLSFEKIRRFHPTTGIDFKVDIIF